MASKSLIVLGFLLVALLFISSTVATRELDESAKEEQTKGPVNEEKHGGGYPEGGGGYPGGGGGYPGGGYPGRGGYPGGGGGYPGGGYPGRGGYPGGGGGYPGGGYPGRGGYPGGGGGYPGGGGGYCRYGRCCRPYNRCHCCNKAEAEAQAKPHN